MRSSQALLVGQLSKGIDVQLLILNVLKEMSNEIKNGFNEISTEIKSGFNEMPEKMSKAIKQ